MLCLDRITLREIHLALKEPFRISSGVESERRILLLELDNGDGASVWAECVAPARPNYTPETIDTAWLAIREWLAPRLLGRELAGAVRRSRSFSPQDIRGHNMAKAALEMGCWGLAAEIQRRPLSLLLGGTRDRVPTGISLGIQPAPGAARRARRRRRRRRLPQDQAQDPARAGRGVRAAVRRGARPRHRDHGRRQRRLHHRRRGASGKLDEFDLLMLEQPLGADELMQLAELQRRMKTPLCLDESIIDVSRARDMIALGSGKIINIKPGRVGGFAASKAIHDVCQDADIPVWCGGMLESGDRPRVQRRARVASQLLDARRSEPERALLDARRRDARSGRWTPTAWSPCRAPCPGSA